MIWAKFPYACPYCHQAPHERKKCKAVMPGKSNLDWDALAKLGKSNEARRPKTLHQFQRMFLEIYPCGDVDSYERTFARFTEEMGELAESLRAFPVAPGYFLSEAADLFAWLLHLHGLYLAKCGIPDVDEGEKLEELFEREYSNRCRECGGAVCICPPILPDTLGRIAHEVQTATPPFAPGGALLTTEAALALFKLGARNLKIGSGVYPVNGELIREIHQMSSGLVALANEHFVISSGIEQKLGPIATTLQQLSAAQRVTQESIDQLARLVAAMPSESRSLVLGFLNNVSAGAWVAALVEAVEQFVKK